MAYRVPEWDTDLEVGIWLKVEERYSTFLDWFWTVRKGSDEAKYFTV
jgi:hypothetical protein